MAHARWDRLVHHRPPPSAFCELPADSVTWMVLGLACPVGALAFAIR